MVFKRVGEGGLWQGSYIVFESLGEGGLWQGSYGL